MSAEAPLGVAPAAAAAEGEEMAAVVDEMAEEAAVWCAVHGLVVGDRAEPVRLLWFPGIWVPARLRFFFLPL